MSDLRQASRNERRASAKWLDKSRQAWPQQLEPLPENEWPKGPKEMKGPMPFEIWRSRDFLVQVYPVSSAIERVSINRCQIDRSGNWSADITWEEIQDLKRQCGRGDLDAVEIYPADGDVVNVANMRHLWVFKTGRLPFAWRARKTPTSGDVG